jgi:hypothetical protein
MGVNEEHRASEIGRRCLPRLIMRVLLSGPERRRWQPSGGRQGGDLFTLIHALTLSGQCDWCVCEAANGRVTL